MAAPHPPSDVPVRASDPGRGIPVAAPLVALGLVMVALAVRAAAPLDDPDLWWHLRAGEGYLRDGWSLRAPPPLTPFATEPWYSRSWSLEIAFAQVQQWFGLDGIAWLYAAGMMAFVVALYVLARSHTQPVVAAIVTLVTVAASMSTLTPRPQLFSFVLLVVVVAAWLHAINTLEPPYWLVPLTWIWATAHGMWVPAIVLGVGIVAGMALDGVATRSQLVRLAAVPVACTLAACLTPQGPRLLTGFLGGARFFPYISEFQSPGLTTPASLAAMALLAIIVGVGLRTRRRMSWAHVALLAQASFWMLYSVRSVSWGAIMAMPLAAMAVQSWLGGDPVVRMSRIERGALAGACAIALVGLAMVQLRTETGAGMVSESVDDALDDLPAGTVVVNAYRLGGWIEWRHPRLVPVIDGNTNGYTLEDFLDYRDATLRMPGWQDYVDGTGASAALLRPTSPLHVALVDSSGWVEVAHDEDFSLLVAVD